MALLELSWATSMNLWLAPKCWRDLKVAALKWDPLVDLDDRCFLTDPMGCLAFTFSRSCAATWVDWPSLYVPFSCHQTVREVLLMGHRQAFAWIDEWHGKETKQSVKIWVGLQLSKINSPKGLMNKRPQAFNTWSLIIVLKAEFPAQLSARAVLWMAPEFPAAVCRHPCCLFPACLKKITQRRRAFEKDSLADVSEALLTCAKAGHCLQLSHPVWEHASDCCPCREHGIPWKVTFISFTKSAGDEMR